MPHLPIGIDRSMKNVLSHVLIPVLVVVIFFQVGSKPVFGLGSQIRGLLTFGIAYASLLVGFLMVHSAFKQKLQGEGLDYWKMAGALILAFPALFQVALAH
jgi:hypothetical protein